MPIPVPQIQQFDIAPTLNAFASGQQTRIGLEDRQRDYERQAEEALFRAVDLADTPEKWNQLVTTLGQQFPDADLSEWTDFSTREAALGQSLDPYQRAQLDLSRRQLALQESNAAAARAAANAPAGTYSDETRNGVLGYTAPDGKWTPYPEWMQEGGEGAGPQYEMLTGPVVEEMIGQGIPLDPTRPYQINTETGEIETVGGQSTGFAFDYDPTTGQVTLRQGAGAGEAGTGTPTQQERQAAALYSNTVTDYDIVAQNFQELANLGNQVGGAIPLAGNFLVSEGYQRSLNATMNILQNYLVVTSGAAVTEQEAERRARQVLPAPGDGPETIADKLRRINEWVSSIRAAGGRALGEDAPPVPGLPYFGGGNAGAGQTGQTNDAAPETPTETWTHPDTGTQYRSGDRTTLNGHEVIIYRDEQGWYAVPTGSN